MKGNLEYRIDPITYHHERRKAIEILKSSKNKLKPLIQVADFGKIIVTENQENLPYLGLENIESETGIYVETTYKESFGSAVKFSSGQILFPKLRPYLNKVHYAEFDGLCSAEFHVIDSSDVDNRYLSHFLRSKIVVSQTKYLMSGNTLPRLQTEDIHKLLIPIPSQETQQTIINIFEKAYAVKKAKEAQAKAILASIDDYLLKELGITLPDKQENSLKNRVFLRNISEVSGGRFDTFYYKDEFEELRKILSKCKNIIRFDSIIDVITKGETPSGEENNYISDGIPFLRVQNISIEGIKKDLMFISREVHNKMKRSKLFGGEILFTMAGSVGVVTLFPDNFGESNINQAIAKITLKKNISVNKIYMIEILNSGICQQQIKKFLTVSAQPNINFEQIKSIEMPLPPLEIQEKIVNHVQAIRDKAKALENEAKEILEQAKAEVERMILGE